MADPRRVLLLARLLFAVLGSIPLLASPAEALPIRYTFSGTLSLAFGTDTLDLDGATITIIADADTTDAPSSTASNFAEELAFYAAAPVAAFTNRPNSAADASIAYVRDLSVANRFSPSVGTDTFGIGSAGVSFQGETIVLPAFSVDFGNLTFLPGTGTPALPVFSPSDVDSIGTTQLRQQPSAPRYDLVGVTAASAVVPEPGTALLLASALITLAARRRRELRR